MNRDTLITGLTPVQVDRLACVACGPDYLRVRVSHVPVGQSMTGSQVFACERCRPDDAQRVSGGVLR